MTEISVIKILFATATMQQKKLKHLMKIDLRNVSNLARGYFKMI